MNYKDTLNLPQTGFSMKAGLVEREPQRLEQWYAEDLHARIRERHAQSKETFVLHDGPPFANGDVHIGTALNKILKDAILKFQTMRGKNVPYVPGWDCHGLPIEFKVVQELRKTGREDATPAEIRRECEAYARKYIDHQRTQFKRLGVFGDWENPYLTLDKKYEADELRLFADIVEKGFVYRGKKPVYWSIPCRTALAEAEVEYADHVSQSIFVKCPVEGQDDTFLIIWTTTPWTLPANLAVAYNSQFTYVRAKVGTETYLLESSLLPKVAETCGWENVETLGEISGAELGELRYVHPFIDKTGPVLAGDTFVENSTGSGFVHIAPGHGLEDYGLGSQNGLPIYSPVDDAGKLAHTDDLPSEAQMPAELIGQSILEKNGTSEANEAVLALPPPTQSTRASREVFAQLPTLLAQQDPGDFPGDGSMVHQDRSREFPPTSARRHQRSELGARLGPEPHRRRGGWPTRLVHQPPTHLGRADPGFYAGTEPILDARIVRNTAALIEEHGSNVWFERDTATLWADVKPTDWEGPEPTGNRWTRSMCGSIPVPARAR